MLRLYDYAASANCFKVRLLLTQLGLAYERVPVNIFASEASTPAFLALNPAGRTPVLQLESGETVAESNAILLYLAEDSELMPGDRLGRAGVWQWLFFEQNLLEPNVGTARFWRLTGREQQRPEVFARAVEMGRGALEILERHLSSHEFLVGGRYSVADVSVYGYAHVAREGGFDVPPAVAAWLARVAGQPGYVDDLEPYPGNARASVGG